MPPSDVEWDQHPPSLIKSFHAVPTDIVAFLKKMK